MKPSQRVPSEAYVPLGSRTANDTEPAGLRRSVSRNPRFSLALWIEYFCVHASTCSGASSGFFLAQNEAEVVPRRVFAEKVCFWAHCGLDFKGLYRLGFVVKAGLE